MTVDSGNSIIRLSELTIGFLKGRQSMVVLKNLHARLNKGELVCLVGENGVGKSTLLRTISGVQDALSGEVIIRDKPLRAYSTQELARTISVVLTDRIYAGNLTVREIVTLGRHPYTNWLGTTGKEDVEKVDWALEITGTRYLEDRLISELSDGQYQKTLIARALAQDSDIILLDEPTAHLDLTNKIMVLKLLKDLAGHTGKSILMATHELELSLQIADHMWMAFLDADMISGTPEDLVLQGHFSKMIRHESVQFEPSNGRFRIKNQMQRRCNLQADEEISSITANALRRIGWEPSDRKEPVEIKIRKVPPGWRWDVFDEENRYQAENIEELLNILKKIQ